MAIYKVGSVAFSSQAIRTVAAVAMAVGVTASLGTYASNDVKTSDSPAATQVESPAATPTVNTTESVPELLN